MDIVLRKPVSLENAIVVTGFRGFGMVGYNVSKHLAMALNAEKIGYILLDDMPPVMVVEEDGVGFPFEIYYSREFNTVIVVNRALPEGTMADAYSALLAEWASQGKVKYSVLVGGLSREYMPPEEEYGYRWIKNRFYHGPSLKAPLMEPGLGVMGPLALLYIYMDYYKVPSIMVLPYTIVNDLDYDAALKGVEVIAREILGSEIDLSELRSMAMKQREELEKLMKALMEQRSGEERGMHM